MTSELREWSAAARPWRVIVATSQVGYRPASPRTVTLLLKGERTFPGEVPYFTWTNAIGSAELITVWAGPGP